MNITAGSEYIREKIGAFKKFTPLLRELVVRDIKVRYRHSALGLVWTVLNPLLMMVVITIVFSTVFKQNIPNFPIYYLSGSLIFSFNSESTTTALNSMISNASLIKKSVYSQISIPVFECAVGIGEFGILINRDVHCHADNRGAVSCDITADANSYLLYIYVRDGTGYPAFGIDSVF